MSDGYDGPITLVWKGDFPVGADAAVVTDIRDNIGVSRPSDLFFHHVTLTDADLDGPLVFVHGKKGSDAFHCEYVEKPDWHARED